MKFDYKDKSLDNVLNFFEMEGFPIKDEEIKDAIHGVDKKYQFFASSYDKKYENKYRFYMEAIKILRTAKKDGTLIDAINKREEEKKQRKGQNKNGQGKDGKYRETRQEFEERIKREAKEEAKKTMREEARRAEEERRKKEEKAKEEAKKRKQEKEEIEKYERLRKNRKFKREKTKDSEIEVIEFKGSNNFIKIDNQNISLDFLNISRDDIKPYIVVERFTGKNIVMIDTVYGDIDIEKMNFDQELREITIDGLLSRKNLNQINERYFGALPIHIVNYNGIYQTENQQDVVKEVGTALRSQVSAIIRETVTKINPMFENSETTSTFQNSPTKKKGFFSQLFKKTIEEINNANSNTKGKSEETQFYKSSSKVLFFKTGAVIIDGRVCSKYSYYTQDEQTGEKAVGGTFLATGIDDERLKTDECYRKKFVDNMCSPSRLKNARGKEFPYIGGFNEKDEFETDIDLFTTIYNLRESGRE